MDYLLRDFPQLKNATHLNCRPDETCPNDDEFYFGDASIDTFRTVEGKYLRVTTKGNEHWLGDVPAWEIEIYEDVWKELGDRALGETDEDLKNQSIIPASDQFFEETDGSIQFELCKRMRESA
jgi:hypothetical protein